MRSVTIGTIYGIGVLASIAVSHIPASAGQPANGLTCSPKTLRSDSVLSLTFPYPHGAYLAVWVPEDTVPYFYAYPGQPEEAELRTFNGRFRDAKSHRLKVAEALGQRWAVDTPPSRIFKRAGTYRFEIGGQFETDGPNVEGSCIVTFRP